MIRLLSHRSTAWRGYLLAIVVIVFSYSFLEASSCADFYPELAVEHIPADLKKGANAVVRYADMEVNLKAVNEVITTESIAISILNKKGIGFLGFYETYKTETEKLLDISIELLNSNGMVIKKIKPKEIEEVAAGGDAIISDRMAKYIQLDTKDFPVTIKYSYKKLSQNTAIPSWFPIPNYRVAVQNSSFKLLNHTSNTIQFQENNIKGFPIEITDSFSYKMEPTKRLIYEKFSPDDLAIFPYVTFRSEQFVYEGIPGSFNDWDSYGLWVYESLLKPKRTVTGEQLRSDLSGNFTPTQDKKAFVKDVYEYVQDNTRYILVDLADGGMVPLSTGTVHEKKYGDCKALTFYTQSILEAYGIPSSYVINESGPKKVSLDPEYCDTYQGDHIILMVPLENDTLWMDCTSGDAPFNFLGAFTDDRLVLAVNEEGGQLVRTPKYGVELNQDVYTISIVLSPDLGISVDYNLTSHGLSMDQRMPYYKMSVKEKEDQLRKEFDHLLNVRLTNLSHEVDKDNLQGKESYTVQVDDYCERAGDYILIPQRFESIYIPNLGKKKSRKYPVLFERAGMESHHEIYTIPEGYLLKTIPEPIELESNYGKYSKKITAIGDDQFEIKRTFELFEGEYPADEYPKIKSFFNKIKKEELSKMTLSKIIRP